MQVTELRVHLWLLRDNNLSRNRVGFEKRDWWYAAVTYLQRPGTDFQGEGVKLQRGEASKESTANLMLNSCHRHTPAHPTSLTPSIHTSSTAFPNPSLAPRAQQTHPAKQRVRQAQELSRSEQRERTAGRGGHLFHQQEPAWEGPVHLAKSQPYCSPSSSLKPQGSVTISTAPRLLLSEILLSLSEGKVRWTDVVPCFSRNWGRGRKGREKKCQSLSHSLTSCAVPNTIFPLPLTINEAQLKMWSVLVESIKQLPRKLVNPTHQTSHLPMSHVHAPAAQTPTGLFIYSQGSQMKPTPG